MATTAPPQLPAAFDRYRAEIEAGLRHALDGRPSPLYDMLRYHLGWRDRAGGPGPGRSGKGLRPTVCLVVSDAVASAHRRALPAAAAVELVHNFSLVHDDIQDGDAERHHRPTVWRVFGTAQAINAGTAMYALAGLALGRLDEEGVPPSRQLTALRLIHASCLRLLEGQYADLDFENRSDVTVDDYLSMIRGKTGALLGCSAALGALLGRSPPDADGTGEDDVVRAFLELGEGLGMAFQIRDDMLGIWGDPRRTGKPVGADIAARKKSFPVVDALERAPEAAQRELLELYRAPEIDAAGRARVLDILTEVGSQARAGVLAAEYRGRALAAVAALDLDAAALADLEAIATFLTERDH